MSPRTTNWSAYAKLAISAPQRDQPDLPLDMVVVDGYRRVVEVTHECRPPLEAVVDGPRDRRAFWDVASLFLEPGAQPL
uniref:Uncharacterized protein n=1 Tax=Ralstonia solanacearum TaxID=305 RepID=A0A0S4TZT3_RALSL|nr:protein of unknown function [Ralstonia solanacearum]